MGKTRKKSWSSYGDEQEDTLSANDFFREGILMQKGTPEARQFEKVANALWDQLEGVHLDAAQRTIIWSDTERLDLEQSIQRVQKQCPGIQRERIEDFLLVWIELRCDPENYSEEQLDELNELTKQWVVDYRRPPKSSKKGGRIRHS
jgi:hypothetical protein